MVAMTSSRSGDGPAASVGNDPAFADLAERHRRELHVHCYRMLASFDDADDAVQETMLRAWRGWASFEGATLARAWLYRIATNVCLDMLRARERRAVSADTFRDLPWLQPYPDALLDEIVLPAPGERRARGCGRRARDDLARVPGRTPDPAPAATGDLDRP